METKTPDISVIVPVYKVEAYIERCAKSLFEQTYDNLEYIFINDCTPDDSMEILDKVLALYPHRVHQVKIINHQTNKGLAAGRNTGLEHATGKYIGWVDSDDWVETAMFEGLYKMAEKHNSDIVWCDFYNSCAEYEARQSQYCKENKIDYIKSVLLGKILAVVWCSIVKKELYIKHNILYPEKQRIMEDMVQTIKLLYFSENIKYVPEAYYHYVKDNADSITARWNTDPAIQEAVQANLNAVFDFLNNTELRFALQKDMRYSKLVYKKGLLNSLDIQTFQQWKELFKEENKYVLSCPNMTLRQKMLGWSISHGWWFVAKIWIYIKTKIIN